MRIMNLRTPRIAGLLALALGAVALLALSGVATAKDRGGDDHGDHGHHGRHHHHLREIEEAGTISSFDQATGRLTIALTGGETASGLVTPETRIRCEGTDDRRADRRDHGGGNDNGGRGNEPGDDNGGHGNEPGDDNGGNSGSGSGDPSVEGESPEVGETPSCTTAALVPGAFVGEAELRLGTGTATFAEIELGQHS
ncbi:MAG: hypothetical protein JWO14_2139 [Solirubrobacterales bacterium]|nr:hypothetical protein [Solirubrobacterales bacterium]